MRIPPKTPHTKARDGNKNSTHVAEPDTIEEEQQNMPSIGDPALAKRYKPTLVAFMSHRDGQSYGKDHEFTQQELAAITPTDLHRWMCFKVYGKEEPSPDDNPVEGRSNSLLYWKKSISFFMPNRQPAWNVLTNSGNPTKSADINDLIKLVKKKEVRRQGKPSSAKRPLEESEFEQAIDLIEKHPDRQKRYFASAAFRFQYNMIGRIDDTCKCKVEDLKPNTQYLFTLLATMCWSKNVMDERDAPDQILLGAMDRRYCVLLGLAVYLETGEESPFLFGIDGIDNPIALKKKASDFVRDNVFKSDEFVPALSTGKLGTHSFRKFASTRARRNGASRDDTDSRARWKRRKRQSDTYIDPCLPWPDAKVASLLCKGGPCKYATREGSGVSDDWILQHVVPKIASRFPRAVALVLGRALLWLVFEDHNTDGESYLPDDLVDQVWVAYRDIPGRVLPLIENPIKKILLLVTGDEGQVYIDELGGGDDDAAVNEDGSDNTGRRTRRRIERDEIRALQSQMAGLRRENHELKAQLEQFSNRTDRQFTTLNRNIRRIAVQPARPIGRNARAAAIESTEDTNEAGPRATLSPHPRSIHTLWQEYEFGIGGRKAAKDFTAAERGRVKYNYHRRKVVWDVIAELVRSGWTANTACDRLHEVYGRNLSVTNIINRMRRDRVNGGHPNLRIVNV